MGNHSDTGDVLQEARELPITEMSVSYVSSLVDEYGNTIELGNPTRLTDSSDRDVVLIKNKLQDDGNKLTLKQVEALIAKDTKNKTS
jgi:hypothetical protein